MRLLYTLAAVTGIVCSMFCNYYKFGTKNFKRYNKQWYIYGVTPPPRAEKKHEFTTGILE